MDALRAEDTLRDHWHGLTAKAIYDLTLLATGGNEAAADEARHAKLKQDLDAGRTPQV